MATDTKQDLVERVRYLADQNTSKIAPGSSPTWVPVMRECADEIERLRADLNHQTERAEGYNGWVTKFEAERELFVKLEAAASKLLWEDRGPHFPQTEAELLTHLALLNLREHRATREGNAE